MSKTIKCDISPFEGQITIPDVLTLPMFIKFRDALEEADATRVDNVLDVFDHMAAGLKGMIPIVEKWDLANFPESPTPEIWPVTPIEPSKALYWWILNTISTAYLPQETSTPKETKEKVAKRNAKKVEDGKPDEVVGDPES